MIGVPEGSSKGAPDFSSVKSVFPKVPDAASADSFQWQITLTRGVDESASSGKKLSSKASQVRL